jgi:hypothetical protein
LRTVSSIGEKGTFGKGDNTFPMTVPINAGQIQTRSISSNGQAIDQHQQSFLYQSADAAA